MRCDCQRSNNVDAGIEEPHVSGVLEEAPTRNSARPGSTIGSSNSRCQPIARCAKYQVTLSPLRRR